MMAADSGGLFARKKDTCLQFASKPTAIVYLPSLNSLVGTLSNGSIEVYDIHSGCMLKQVDFTGKIDQTPHQLWAGHGTHVKSCKHSFMISIL